MSNNIVKQSQLQEILEHSWTKTKERDIEKLEYDSSTKTIKGKSDSNTNLNIGVSIK